MATDETRDKKNNTPRSFTRGRMSRFFRLGSLSGLVGFSYIGHKVKSIGATPEEIEESLHRTNERNAERIARTFGQLKGAVMKVGQMMSLQSGIFPEEFTSSLSSLQQDSPPIDFEIIRSQVEQSLGGTLESLFRSFNPEAHASASIGQVHRAVLPDGHEVVVKVQYPGVEEMVNSDLKNLRMFFKSLAKAKLDMDVMQLWGEIRERLNEELNYEIEMRNMLEFRTLFAQDSRVIIPEPIPEYSTHQVLTMDYVPGLDWAEVIDDAFPGDVRTNLAVLLFETLVRQIFTFRQIQADPNLSNYAFSRDGRLILYDFGCVKKFPVAFIETYRQMVLAGLDGNFAGVTDHFRQLGFDWTPREAIDHDTVAEVARILLKPYLPDYHFDFGQATLHLELFEFARKHFQDKVKFVIPPDILFLDRLLGGMYGNMMTLKARGNWRDLLVRMLSAPNGR